MTQRVELSERGGASHLRSIDAKLFGMVLLSGINIGLLWQVVVILRAIQKSLENL